MFLVCLALMPAKPKKTAKATPTTEKQKTTKPTTTPKERRVRIDRPELHSGAREAGTKRPSSHSTKYKKGDRSYATYIMKLALDKKIDAARQQAETLRQQISDMDASVISPQGLKPINCDFDTKLLSLSAEQCAVIGTVIQYTRRARMQCGVPKAEWEKWIWGIKAGKVPLRHFGLQEP